ncbi:cellulose binding domain-containing protein [Lentzea sp. NPDC042327]|uniref:cellulose binding domain-containing protein n=1 Tax=Lentzea sp. NPDC042327 TaxID=3154801 RepID=UPI0033C60BE8
MAVLVAGAASACGDDEPPAPPAQPVQAEVPTIGPPRKEALTTTVQRVLDVRTVQLSDGEQVEVEGLAEPDACWSDAATAFARTVLLEKPVESTSTGSLRLADGTDYAVLAVELGMVRSEAGDDRVLREAEASASAKGLGRWGPPCVRPSTPVPPPAPDPVVPTPATTTPAAPQPVTGCSVEYRVTNSWPGGFRTDVTIRNTGTTDVTGWTLRWKFANGQTVTEMWNATHRQTGADVSATAVSYNQAIPRGGTVPAGFTASGGSTNTAPRAFSLNGFACTVV